jgi:transposase
MEEIKSAKKRFGLAADTPVVSCFEIGRDGFWIDRALRSGGIHNVVVESASIEVNRRRRRRKTDRLDATKLLNMLMRFDLGEDHVWQVVNVPTVQEEDARQLHRELMTIRRDRTRLINQIKGLLAAQGVRLKLDKRFLQSLEGARLFDGQPLAEGLKRRLQRAFQRLVFIDSQAREMEKERIDQLRQSPDHSAEIARSLLMLQGIGINSAWLYSKEIFAWRRIRNRRELASLVGLTPTPYDSGESQRDQGISKAGSRWVRAMAIEIAWSWLRNQPQSKLSLWYQKRFGGGGSRQRKIGIVALARRLLVALWKYVETGEIPEGARLTDWESKLVCKSTLAAV